jgi:Uma2 family endonuclease
MHTQLPLDIDKPGFLAWGERKDGRYELVQGRVVMTPPSTRRHALMRMDLFSLISAQLEGGVWKVFMNFGVDTGPRNLRYPDIVVDRAGGAGSDLTATEPALIVEVLSPSTAEANLGDKPAEYLRLPSLFGYLVFSQDEPKAWVWVRGSAGFSPGPEVVAEQGVIRVPALRIDLPLAVVYGEFKKN